jgi:hypothetical protein
VLPLTAWLSDRRSAVPAWLPASQARSTALLVPPCHPLGLAARLAVPAPAAALAL